MKVLITGTTGYIGKRILLILKYKGYDVIYCVRDKKKISS
ncbi:NAD-dependent epimerase/dehydratase family protein [Labilibacter sediminis]|nr:NAD-dependent epimerase/dehydratase family protein [Labilibacter sediminis]